MRRIRLVILTALVASVAPLPALAQALPSLSTLRVQYNTRKATVRPEGELQARIAEVDREIAEATRQGQTGEVRRLIAKGNTLLSGREWTPELDFDNSLVIRTDRLIVDPAGPYAVRLEQIYRPATELDRALVVTAALRERARAAGEGTALVPGSVLRELGRFEGVSRDLRESPHFLDLELQGVPDGTYFLVVEVGDGERTLGSANLTVNVRQGLDALVQRLEEDAARAPEHLRADILFPIDRMRQVNRGEVELRIFDAVGDFAAAETVAAAVRAGVDPFEGRTGDFKRHHLLEIAGEIMPYRLYVPTGYSPDRPHPLIVALHGLGGTENSFFESYEGVFPRLAEERGYILVAPMGYRVDGFYGWGVGSPPADLNTRRVQERSEADVMRVLELSLRDYNVDPDRIYLMGHSMGAIGTWRIAPKYPDIWAAIGAFAGSGSPASAERMRHLPNFVVHGDADATVGVQDSRAMVAAMRELGMTLEYIEVPGGSHSGVVAPHARAMFDFFDAHRKARR